MGFYKIERYLMKFINFIYPQWVIVIMRIILDAFSQVDPFWYPAPSFLVLLGNYINSWPVIGPCSSSESKTAVLMSH